MLNSDCGVQVSRNYSAECASTRALCLRDGDLLGDNEHDMGEWGMRKSEQITYLGDGVYGKFDGYQIMLWTSDGLVLSQMIAIEPEVWDRLMDLAEQVNVDFGKKYFTLGDSP